MYLVSWINQIWTSHTNKPYIPFFLSMHERLVGFSWLSFFCVEYFRAPLFATMIYFCGEPTEINQNLPTIGIQYFLHAATF